ncbi:MAG TPA: PspC domain-containing protein [Bryobacteraceae bacterium]
MYCSSCGIEIADSNRYCPQCGASTGTAGFTPRAGQPPKPLSRPREDRKIAGVGGGLARFLGIDVTLVRILFLVFTIWPPGVGLIVYLICWIVMPQDPLLLPPARSARAQNATATR